MPTSNSEARKHEQHRVTPVSEIAETILRMERRERRDADRRQTARATAERRISALIDQEAELRPEVFVAEITTPLERTAGVEAYRAWCYVEGTFYGAIGVTRSSAVANLEHNLSEVQA